MSDGRGFTPLVNLGELPCVCPDCTDVCMAEAGVIGRCRDCRDPRDGRCHDPELREPEDES